LWEGSPDPEIKKTGKGEMMMLKVAIVGAAGYTGGELFRILLRHPRVEVTYLAERKVYQGKRIDEVYPNLKAKTNLKFEELNLSKIGKLADLVFLALPDGVAMNLAPEILKKGKKVIDFSGDFRLKNVDTYKEWYKIKHKNPALVKKAVYGLPEIYKKKIRRASLIANPGCYATSAILGLAPLMDKDIANLSNIIIDSKSGVSGAGRSLSTVTHFPECNESMKAYKIGLHDHTPEIEQELGKLAQKKIKVSFTPHLIPLSRGILSTIYLSLKRRISVKELLRIYREFYQDAPFVRVLKKDELPSTKFVYAGNYLDLGIVVDKRVGRLVIVTAIDNLVKGAAGQAVENMNIMFGNDETLGLEEAGIFP